MISLFLTLFLSGVLTIFLPCILPLIPIVVGASIAGKSKIRPLLVCVGMFLSFVGSTFIIYVFLNQFPELADLIRIGSYYILLLFGLGFFSAHQGIRYGGTALGALFFLGSGWIAVLIALVCGMTAMALGGIVAQRLQQAGTDVQAGARNEFGSDSTFTAFIIGLTLGLVWVPCAGPALAFALTLVREQPGPLALAALAMYAFGASLPLLIVGYGGQWAVHSIRSLTKFTGLIKKVAGVVLILTAVALQYNVLIRIETWLTTYTGYGTFANKFEEQLFTQHSSSSISSASPSSASRSSTQSSAGSHSNVPMPSSLPKIVRAPELASAGPWHNSEPLTMAGLKGKVVLVDFWTYSCINCIRTLPYIQGYWDKYKDTGKFVVLSVHTPEFAFEKLEKNVSMAIKEHGLTYPVVQDNDFGTWTAFSNRYWPAKYLIDADGYVRYEHFGEGDYGETDKAIESLLGEIGVTVSDKGQGTSDNNSGSGNRQMSPETYVGSRNWPAFGNAKGEPTGEAITYTTPTSSVLNKYYLVGQWQLMGEEYQTLRSDSGEIRMKFLGSEINLVMGLEDGAAPVKAEVMIDGKSVKGFMIDQHDLYNLANVNYGEHEMVLKLTGKGAQAYAFTFGS